MYCTGLNKVEIPNSVTSVGTAAFMACYNLTEVTLGAGLKEIPEDIFFYCQAMEKVTLNKGITKIGKWAFFGCDDIKTINFKGSASDWKAIVIGNPAEYENGADKSNPVLFKVTPSYK